MRILSLKSNITTDPKEHICPACGAKTSKIHDYREQTIKDLPFQFSTHILCFEKEGMLALVERGFMSLMTFYLAITA